MFVTFNHDSFEFEGARFAPCEYIDEDLYPMKCNGFKSILANRSSNSKRLKWAEDFVIEIDYDGKHFFNYCTKVDNYPLRSYVVVKSKV